VTRKNSTYLGAVVREGSAAADLWTGVFLGQAPLNCTSQLDASTFPEKRNIHLCISGIGATLKPAVAVGGIDWETVEEACEATEVTRAATAAAERPERILMDVIRGDAWKVILDEEG
jgi:hypothetical protein